MTLEIKHLSFAYRPDKPVLNDISLSVTAGEILGILGPNGTGKTTFIQCINNILPVTMGKVFLNGHDIVTMSPQETAKFIAYVPQYTDNYFQLNVIDAVMLGRLPYARKHYSENDKALVFDILQRMQLEALAFRTLNTLSGGERQRVFIARALAQQPRCIILDEPTSSLDLHNQLFILHTITNLARQNNISIIMTIHDLNLASMFCDNILMLKETRTFAYGSAQSVLGKQVIDTMYNVKTTVTVEDSFKHIRLLKNL